MSTINWHRRMWPVCIASYPDLMARASANADRYASTPDGGYPGTPAAIAYHAEGDAINVEAARRTASLIRLLFTGVSS